MMTIAEQWVQEGRQEGLNSERQLVLRLVRRRFGAAVMERSGALLERIAEPAVLEELGEGVLDCADGKRGWRCWRGGRADYSARRVVG